MAQRKTISLNYLQSSVSVMLPDCCFTVSVLSIEKSAEIQVKYEWIKVWKSGNRKKETQRERQAERHRGRQRDRDRQTVEFNDSR